MGEGSASRRCRCLPARAPRPGRRRAVPWRTDADVAMATRVVDLAGSAPVACDNSVEKAAFVRHDFVRNQTVSQRHLRHQGPPSHNYAALRADQ